MRLFEGRGDRDHIRLFLCNSPLMVFFETSVPARDRASCRWLRVVIGFFLMVLIACIERFDIFFLRRSTTRTIGSGCIFLPFHHNPFNSVTRNLYTFWNASIGVAFLVTVKAWMAHIMAVSRLKIVYWNILEFKLNLQRTISNITKDIFDVKHVFHTYPNTCTQSIICYCYI